MLNRRLWLGSAALSLLAVPAHGQAPPDIGALQRALDEATARGRPLEIDSTIALARPLRLGEGAHLMGRRGARLLQAGSAPLLQAGPARRITVEGLTLEGGGRALGAERGLLEASDVQELVLSGVTLRHTPARGAVLQRCGGRVEGCRIERIGRGALFALDSTGLAITGNGVRDCGENGIQIWRSAASDDGTLVSGNRISGIRAEARGTGEYGNAISIFRAGGVVVSGNVVRDCAYTAVRCNSGRNVSIVGNSAQRLGECAIFVEFAFDGAVVANNIVEGAYEGIQVTNFADHGGRLASVSGNVIRTMRRGPHPGDGSAGGGRGIFVEADAAVTGNVIDDSDRLGLQLGWGESLRDVVATGNLIRNTPYGIGISVAPGAGQAVAQGNSIAAARIAAIAAMRWHEWLPGDLAKDGAGAHRTIRLADNVVR